MALIDDVDSFYSEEAPPTETTKEPSVEITSVKDSSGNKWDNFLGSLYGETQEQPAVEQKQEPVVGVGLPFQITPTNVEPSAMFHAAETGEKLDRGEAGKGNWLYENLKTGYMKGEAATGDFLSNIAMLLENNTLNQQEMMEPGFSLKRAVVQSSGIGNAISYLRQLADSINSYSGGSDNILGSLKNYFKNAANAARPEPEKNPTIPGAVVQGVAELPATLSAYLLGTALTGGNAVAGMALVDGIKNADKGTVSMIEGAAKGAMLGKILHALNIFNVPVKMGVMGTLFGTSTALEGGGLNESVASGILGAGLGYSRRSPNVSIREAIRQARKPFGEVPEGMNPMAEARLDAELEDINQLGERGRVYPPEEPVGREGVIAPTSELWAQLGGRQTAIMETYDYLKNQGFSTERISSIMDMLFPAIDWKNDVILVNKNIEQPNMIEQPTPEQVVLAQAGKDQTMPEAGPQEAGKIVAPTEAETTLIGGEKKPYMGAREEETIPEKKTGVIQSTTENQPGEVTGLKEADDIKMQELARKDPALWTAEDKAFYDRYMSERKSGLEEEVPKPAELVIPTKEDIKNYGKSIEGAPEEKVAKENEPLGQEQDTGLKDLRNASVGDPIGQKKLSKALWNNVGRLPKKSRAAVEKLLMQADMEQDLGKAGLLLEEAAQRMHREMPLVRNTMVEEMSEGNPPTGINLGTGPWQSLYEKFFPETRRESSPLKKNDVDKLTDALDSVNIIKGTDEYKGEWVVEHKDSGEMLDVTFGSKKEAIDWIKNNLDMFYRDYLSKENKIVGGPVQETGFYSKLGEIVSQKVGKKIPVDQLQKMLLNAGVKKQEMKFSGMNDFIDTFKGQTVTKQQIVNYLKEHELLFNDLDIEEPKFERFIRGGGTNYQEKLITFNYPKGTLKKVETLEDAAELGYTIKSRRQGRVLVWDIKKGNEQLMITTNRDAAIDWLNLHLKLNDKDVKQDYTRGHWEGEPGAVNVIGSMLTKDDTAADGGKILGIREIQSDWDLSARKEGGYGEREIQEGREPITNWTEAMTRGYALFQNAGRWVVQDHRGSNLAEIPVNEYDYAGAQRIGIEMINAIEENRITTRKVGVPDMPFRDKWYEVVLKRAIKYAIDNGYDYISWSTGKQVAEQYHLNKYVDRISWEKDGDAKQLSLDLKGQGNISMFVEKDGKIGEASNAGLAGRDLREVVGKEVAEKILSAKRNGELKDLDLVITPEGKDALYDVMIPSFMNKFAGKQGGKVLDIPREMTVTVKPGEDFLREFKNDKTTKDMLEENDGMLYGFDDEELTQVVKAMKRGYFKSESEIIELKKYLRDNVEEFEGDPEYSQKVKQLKGWLDELNKITIGEKGTQPGLQITPEFKANLEKNGMALYSGIDITKLGRLFHHFTTLDKAEKIKYEGFKRTRLPGVFQTTKEARELWANELYGEGEWHGYEPEIAEILTSIPQEKAKDLSDSKVQIAALNKAKEILGKEEKFDSFLWDIYRYRARRGDLRAGSFLLYLDEMGVGDRLEEVFNSKILYKNDTGLGPEIIVTDPKYVEAVEAYKVSWKDADTVAMWDELRNWSNEQKRRLDRELELGNITKKEWNNKEDELWSEYNRRYDQLELDSRELSGQLETGEKLFSGIDPTRIWAYFMRKGEKNRPVADKAARSFNRILDFFDPGLSVPDSKHWFYNRQAAKGGVAEGEYLADEFTKMYKDVLPDDRRILWDFMNGTKSIGDLPDHLRTVGKELRSLDNKLGTMLVNAGIMSEETFEAMKDKHIRYIYNTNMTGENFVAGSQAGAKIPYKAFEQRKELTDLEMERLGLIRDPIKALTQSIVEVHKAVAMKDYFEKVASNKDWIYQPSVVEFEGRKMGIGKAKDIVHTIDTIEKTNPHWLNADQIEYRNNLREAIKNHEAEMKLPSGEFVQLNGKHYGELDGMYVNRTIANDMKPIFSMAQKFDSELLRKTNYYLDTATSMWKLKSVALNLPTAARNCISNTVQMWMSGMPLYRMPGYFYRAAEAVKGKTEIYHQAMKQGLFKGNWSASELNDLLEIAKTEGKGLDAVLEMARKMGKYYGKIDDFFKMSKFIEGMDKGLGEAESARLANRWGMDYSLAHPSIKYLRSTPLGAPFITYQYKVLPLIAEAMMKRPWTVMSLVALPYILQKVLTKDMSDEEAKKYTEALPEYVKNGQTLIIPGTNGMHAMDISYMVPWGNWWQTATEMSKGDIPKATRETGIAGGLIPSLLYALKTGKDLFTGEDIISPLERKSPKLTAMALTKYIWNQSMPGMFSTYGVAGKAYDYMKSGTTKTGTELGPENVFPRLAGVNIYPIDPRSGLIQKKHDINEVKKALYKKMLDKTIGEDEKDEIRMIYKDYILNERAK